MFEICVIPTLLYGAENWILDNSTLTLLEKFQAEIGRRILRLPKCHSRLSVLIALRWPSMRARILNIKLSFLCRLLSPKSDIETLATRTFNTLAGIDIYQLSLVQQCLYLDSTDATSSLLNSPENCSSMLRDSSFFKETKRLFSWTLLIILQFLRLQESTG